MSTTAIQQVADGLRELPESDQSLVLDFLQALKHKRRSNVAATRCRGRNPALRKLDDALVFTGEIGGPGTDWLRVARQEREAEIMGVAADTTERK